MPRKGNPRKHPEEAIAEAEAEDDKQTSACGFDQTGEQLVEDDSASCARSLLPDLSVPSVQARAAVIQAAAALEAEEVLEFEEGGDLTACADTQTTSAAAVAAAPAPKQPSPPASPSTVAAKYAKSLIEGWKRMLTSMRAFIQEHSKVLTEFPLRAASYYHPAGQDRFAEDMHLSSTACGRSCPLGCRFCKDPAAHPKMSRADHITYHERSFGIFDRPSHQAELLHALETGVMGETLMAFYTAHFAQAQAAVNPTSVERKVGQLRKGVARCTSQISYGRLLLKIGDNKTGLCADPAEWAQWLMEADLQEKKRSSHGKDPAGYVAQLAVLKRLADEKKAAEAARNR